MRIFVMLACSLLLAACAAPIQYSSALFQPYDQHTEYSIEERESGFTITVHYSRYQFIPESDVVGRACTTQLTVIAHEVAEKRGREIAPINPQRIKISMGRNGLTGITSCAANAPAEYASASEKKTAKSSITRGTGFVVRPDGTVLTAFHLVENARSITVKCPNRETVPATLSQTARSTDLAVLRIPLSGLSYLSLARAGSMRPGDSVFTIGFPTTEILGAEPKFTDGAVSALTGIQGEATLMQVTVPIQPGNSGGPLLNSEGLVVGILTSTLAIRPFLSATGTLPQNVNWAVKSDYAAPLFDQPEPQRPAADRRAAIDKVLQSTCLIEASQ